MTWEMTKFPACLKCWSPGCVLEIELYFYFYFEMWGHWGLNPRPHQMQAIKNSIITMR